MKTLNDDTIKQLGNGILDKIRGRYNAYFIGTYDPETGGVDFGNTLYNRNGKLAVNVGDYIIVNHQGITEPVYYTGTFNINFDTNTSYTVFTVLDIESDSSIYIDALDKAGNKVFINNGIDRNIFYIGLKEAIIPIIWNHTTWNSNNRIQSLVSDSNFLKFKEGDKIKFGAVDNEAFFNATTVEIKKFVISDKINFNSFSFEIVLAKDFGYSEEVQITCNGTFKKSLSGTISYTEKQRKISTNCPTYILGTMNNNDITDCTSIILPKGEITIDAQLRSEYLPKVGDVVCAYNSPTITDYGFYAATIEYIQTTYTSKPYAMLGVAGLTFIKYFMAEGAFVTNESDAENNL